MESKTMIHLVSASFIIGGVFIILFFVINGDVIEHWTSLFFVVPFMAFLFSIAIDVEMSQKRSHNKNPISLRSLFLFYTSIAGFGIHTIGDSKNIPAIIFGGILIAFALFLIIFTIISFLKGELRENKSSENRSNINGK
jgi:hypothetical protein